VGGDLPGPGGADGGTESGGDKSGNLESPGRGRDLRHPGVPGRDREIPAGGDHVQRRPGGRGGRGAQREGGGFLRQTGIPLCRLLRPGQDPLGAAARAGGFRADRPLPAPGRLRAGMPERGLLPFRLQQRAEDGVRPDRGGMAGVDRPVRRGAGAPAPGSCSRHPGGRGGRHGLGADRTARGAGRGRRSHGRNGGVRGFRSATARGLQHDPGHDPGLQGDQPEAGSPPRGAGLLPQASRRAVATGGGEQHGRGWR